MCLMWAQIGWVNLAMLCLCVAWLPVFQKWVFCCCGLVGCHVCPVCGGYFCTTQSCFWLGNLCGIVPHIASASHVGHISKSLLPSMLQCLNQQQSWSLDFEQLHFLAAIKAPESAIFWHTLSLHSNTTPIMQYHACLGAKESQVTQQQSHILQIIAT